MPETPYLPVSSVSATRSSTESVSSSVLARASCINASTSASASRSAFACLLYAASPFSPYVISSLSERMSSFSVASTPTSAAVAMI